MISSLDLQIQMQIVAYKIMINDILLHGERNKKP